MGSNSHAEECPGLGDGELERAFPDPVKNAEPRSSIPSHLYYGEYSYLQDITLVHNMGNGR
jgi:hypothetical protein